MDVIEKSVILPFTVETVFAAWISQDTVIPPATRMDIDPRVGGHYRLIMSDGLKEIMVGGKFSVFKANERLVYGWVWSGFDEQTEIDVRFEASDQSCRIDLTHSGFDNQISRDNHDGGWDSYFSGLENFLRN